MPANAMAIEDVYAVLNDIHEQVTGQAVLGGINTANYVSVANTVLQQGTDVVYNAMMNTIARTIFSTRPYSRQFGGLIVDNLKWGAVVRKVQFGDTDAVADSAFSGLPADGQSVDHYTINRGDVLETRYYGSAEYQDVMTVFRDQLITAFNGPDQLGSFIAAKANEINNKWVQWTEDLARGLVMNAISAKTYYDSITYTHGPHCLHLLTMYNTDTGASPALTIQDIMTEQYAKPFWEYVRAKIRSLQREFSNRTVRYQVEITGHKIVRHTPYRYQNVYLLAPYMDLMETSTLTEAFHNDPLKYADYEGVSYWQNPASPDIVELSDFTLLQTNGRYNTYSTLENTDPTDPDAAYGSGYILGMVFDDDFMNINIKDTIIQNTPMNARGLYYNTWLTAHAQYCQDFTEKCCVLLLD